ncbi:MAG: hypothetical protein IJH14_07505 [Solobacterium sp.]|nr:hypothetical protein [Solobacterium sp.]
MERLKNNADLIFIVILLILGLASAFFAAGYFTSPEFTEGTLAYLNQKRNTVMEITAASTAASAAISLIPGDAGSAIADKLADLSMYALLVLCAIFLEKYLVTITGSLAFRILIPAGCLLGILYCAKFKKPVLRQMAVKVAALGLVLFMVVPVSVQTSKSIEETYHDSIEMTIDQAKESSEQVENNAKTESAWDSFVNTITGGVSSVLSGFENVLNNFIEALAVMIVTSFLIPIIVLMFFWWAVKMIFQAVPEPIRAQLPAPPPSFKSKQ